MTALLLFAPLAYFLVAAILYGGLIRLHEREETLASVVLDLVLAIGWGVVVTALIPYKAGYALMGWWVKRRAVETVEPRRPTPAPCDDPGCPDESYHPAAVPDFYRGKSFVVPIRHEGVPVQRLGRA